VVAAGILLGVAQVLAQTPDPQPAGYVSDPARPARMAAPLVTEFREKNPGVQVHLVLSDAGLDVIDDGLDVALRVGLPSDSSVIAKKVLTAKRIVCASPDYFKKHGTPAKPSDLLQHDCIRLVRGRRVMDA
jgi:DNA-binding transcriptional LysR family regulator